MIEVQGKFNTAKIYTDNVEKTAMSQIIELCNQEFAKDSQIRIMPDTHAGAGCTIGTTMTIQDKVVPNLVGVDIGCGMMVTKINVSKDEINFDQLDDVIHKYVPSGFGIHSKHHWYSDAVDIEKVLAPVNVDRAKKSIGTLGGGNHFIEINEGSNGCIYLVIHSGSRNLGKQVAEHYQKFAYEELSNATSEKEKIIAQLKAEGREQDIHEALRGVKSPKIKKDLAYLQGDGFKDYMHDMKIAQNYAAYNRLAMSNTIMKHMGWDLIDRFDSIHNFIDIDNMILRKGATTAQEGERLIIPINMRDGSIIATGKGNPDWNFSGPHGAGRIMSRSKAKENLKLEDFQETMKQAGIWTSSVSENTLDEAPMVYKPMEEIISNINDTVEINEIIKPLYNFKAN
ncbi:RtcB family protein [Bacillus sp. FSL H8-0515]|uniref:RtcB family protein n=1 Tax=Bacillus sp. FSL H8-0515 TaxID=2921396 RepID=UPI0030F84435